MIYHTTICKRVTTPLHHLPLHLSAKNEEKKENETEQTPVDCIVFPGSGTELSRRSFRRSERRVNSYLIPHLSARARGVYACCRSKPINFASSSFFSLLFSSFFFRPPTFPLEFARNLTGGINYFLLPAPSLRIRPPHSPLSTSTGHPPAITALPSWRNLSGGTVDYYIFLCDECHRLVSWPQFSRCTHCDLHANRRRYAPDNEPAAPPSREHTQALIPAAIPCV